MNNTQQNTPCQYQKHLITSNSLQNVKKTYSLFITDAQFYAIYPELKGRKYIFKLLKCIISTISAYGEPVRRTHKDFANKIDCCEKTVQRASELLFKLGIITRTTSGRICNNNIMHPDKAYIYDMDFDKIRKQIQNVQTITLKQRYSNYEPKDSELLCKSSSQKLAINSECEIPMPLVDAIAKIIVMTKAQSRVMKEQFIDFHMNTIITDPYGCLLGWARRWKILKRGRNKKFKAEVAKVPKEWRSPIRKRKKKVFKQEYKPLPKSTMRYITANDNSNIELIGKAMQREQKGDFLSRLQSIVGE